MTSQHDAATAVRILAERTGTDAGDWYLVFKARYGMQVVFRAVARARGAGDVVTQVFTCSTAVDPVLAAGLTPRYAEVSPKTVSIDPERLVLGRGTRAVVVQHTFGIVDDAGATRLRDRAHAAGAVVVEDAAHCVGRVARDAQGRPVADVSVHSFGVEKMLPTRFGGAVWVSPELEPGLRQRVVDDLAALPAVGRRLDVVTRLYRSQVRVLNRLPRALGGRVRSALTAVGAFEPAVSAAERRGGLPYPPMRPSAWMVGQIAAHLAGLAAGEARRTQVVAQYVRDLHDLVEIPAAVGAGQPLVRFPFFARDAEAASRVVGAVTAAGFYAGQWYRPALFPVDDVAAYGYVPGDGSLATTEDLIARVVNLPTAVTLDDARRITAVVRATVSAGGSSRT